MKLPDWTLILAALIVIGAIVVLLERVRSPGGSPWPYYAKRPLSNPEQVLYHRLVEALPECIILAQVQLSRVLGVKKGHRFHEWNNRINRLSLDFVVCLKDSTVVAAIELDDRSHLAEKRKEADARKDKALSAAGIPLIRWKVSELPDREAIRLNFTR